MMQSDRPQMLIQCGAEKMRFACQISKTRIQTHSKYLILIAFTRKQWLRERASMLRCTYLACLVYFIMLRRDFHLFLKMKEHLAGKRHADDEDLQHAVVDWLNSQAAVWYEEEISKLVSR